jgi:hypothetical protein
VHRQKEVCSGAGIGGAGDHDEIFRKGLGICSHSRKGRFYGILKATPKVDIEGFDPH